MTTEHPYASRQEACAQTGQHLLLQPFIEIGKDQIAAHDQVEWPVQPVLAGIMAMEMHIGS